MKKIVTITGARPQFVKAAVLSRLIRSEEWNDKFVEFLVHTGQHYDQNMSDVFFADMEIPKPDYSLNIGSDTHAKMTGQMLIKIEEVLLKENPDLVLVYGDTNSTLAGALAASKLFIPVVHVEAGLRSFWKKMPEEQNRVLTDHISDFLFCPTETAVKNLKKEGITQGVYAVGDIMYDAYLYYNEKIKIRREKIFKNILQKYNIPLKSEEDFYLLTLHRAENTDDPFILSEIVEAINSMKIPAIFPIHPRTKKQLEKYKLSLNRHIYAVEPLGYFDILTLQSYCAFIVTDSGGMQKEACFAKKPCITLREQTEWVETVESGLNILAGTNKAKIFDSVAKLKIPDNYPNFYGSGNSGSTILNILNDNISLKN